MSNRIVFVVANVCVVPVTSVSLLRDVRDPFNGFQDQEVVHQSKETRRTANIEVRAAHSTGLLRDVQVIYIVVNVTLFAQGTSFVVSLVCVGPRGFGRLHLRVFSLAIFNGWSSSLAVIASILCRLEAMDAYCRVNGATCGYRVVREVFYRNFRNFRLIYPQWVVGDRRLIVIIRNLRLVYGFLYFHARSVGPSRVTTQPKDCVSLVHVDANYDQWIFYTSQFVHVTKMGYGRGG